MKKHLVTRLAALTAGALATAGLAAGPANAEPAERAGSKSLASVLAADGTRLDGNWKDFDILETAVLAVVQADPNSPVALLTDGKVRLTAFLPNDNAFRNLVGDLTGTKPRSEKKVVDALLTLADLKTVETVLLYHVVPGKTLDSPKVVAAAKQRAKLKTAQGGTVKVKMSKGKIVLVDKDRDIKNPMVILKMVDINKGNKQIGHGINRVLLPVDL